MAPEVRVGQRFDVGIQGLETVEDDEHRCFRTVFGQSNPSLPVTRAIKAVADNAQRTGVRCEGSELFVGADGVNRNNSGRKETVRGCLFAAQVDRCDHGWSRKIFAQVNKLGAHCLRGLIAADPVHDIAADRCGRRKGVGTAVDITVVQNEIHHYVILADVHRVCDGGSGRLSRVSRLVVLDTPALYYRSFYALPSSITAADGTPVGALRGLLDTIAGLAEDLGSTRIVAAMDGDWRPAFRTAIVPEYKAQRVQDEETGSETPDDLKPQIPLIREALGLVGIPVLEIPGTEADDIIGSFAAQMGPDDELVVVSPDRDLISVLREDRRIQLHRPRPKGQWAPLTYPDVPAEYGVKGGTPYREMAALRGDPSDGLPGVPGIGEKTAAKLLAGYGGLDELFRAAASGAKDHGLSPKRAAALLENEDAVRRAEKVMAVLEDLDVVQAAKDAAAVPQRMNREALSAFGSQWSTERAVARLLKTLGGEVPPRAAGTSPAAGRQVSKNRLPAFTGPSWTTSELWGFDLETTGLDPHTVHIVTAACVRLGKVNSGIEPLEIRTWLADPGIEIPEAASSVHGITSDYARKHGADRTAVVAEVIACLESIRRRGGSVVGHNIVYDLTVLEAERRRLGLPTPVADVLPPIFDTLVLDREVDRFRRGQRTLADLCAVWGVELDNHHDALADATAAGCILWAMAAKHELLASGSGEELHAAQIEWKRAQAADLEEFLRSKGRHATINPDWPLEI